MGSRARNTAFAAVAALAATAVSAGDPSPAFEYVRDKNTVDATVRSILARAQGDASVVFVFDAATFDPPPGRSEFDAQHRFAGDLPTWIAAIRDAAPKPVLKPGVTADRAGSGVFVAATTSLSPVLVGAPKWEALLGGELHASRWDDKSFKGFAPAHQWATRLLQRVGGPKKTLAFVTGDVLPETWIRVPPYQYSGQGMPGVEPWRRKLSDMGAYWDAEKFGAAVASAGARLVVVAPESRFGDFLPLEEIPQAPWASRPMAPPQAPPVPPAGTTPGGMPSGPGGGVASEEAIKQLEKTMRAAGLPEEAIRAAVAKLRAGSKSGGGEGAKRETREGGRYESLTPLWFPFWGQQKFFNADSPSAYGYWPFARAAARAGGAYYLYPFPAAPWADVCPRDPSLVDALAPELVASPEFARLRTGDQALAAMLEAQRIVFDSTPWTDGSRGFSQGGASSWSGFESPGAPASRWRVREKPWDAFLETRRSLRTWREEGRKLVPVVADYERAIRVLAAAQEKLAAKTLEGTCRRSEANLRLCRFWFEMSAFHLDALRIYLTELERFMPPGADDREILITYVPAIKMSDCLDAYDGREISAADEAAYGTVPRGMWRDVKGEQSNFLAVPPDDANFRAKRALDKVLKNLDPRLVPRAKTMIDAARDVMAHEAKCGWGWVTYYSYAHTFIWLPVPPGDGEQDRHGNPDEPPPTPHTPSGGGGTSTPK